MLEKQAQEMRQFSGKGSEETKDGIEPRMSSGEENVCGTCSSEVEDEESGGRLYEADRTPGVVIALRDGCTMFRDWP